MATNKAASKTTTDHKQIQQWIEDRNGIPARVKGTVSGEGAGLLRVDFKDNGEDDKLEQISWKDFFDTFEKKNLAFLYQEETKDGGTSRFFKFVDRE